MNAVPEVKRNNAGRYSYEARRRAAGRIAFDSEIHSLKMDPASARTVTKAAPPEQVAAILGVSPEEISTVKRARIMLANETPVQLADSYIPVEIADGTALEAENSGPGGIIARFAEMASLR
ncbi:UTRA domain-containing protein [Streptomyces caniscabiei]|uniref:UTRA domain-containing protein n=1 Tax=Streptomyces caniscabiei TaxID=2746961 RepID=UPI000A474C55|nr:UTRA domain-containing protein [Streptomyces caniscabiei]